MRLAARIGAIEFDGDHVRIAVVKTGGRRPVVIERQEGAAVYTAPEQRPSALVQAVHDAVAALKKRPPVFMLCSSTQFAVVRAIRMPFRGKRKVAAAVRFELEPYLAFPIEDLVVDYSVIREVDRETEVLAVGLRKASLEEQLSLLEQAGINIEGIGIDAAGLTSLWASGRRFNGDLEAVLHVRKAGAILAVAHGKSLTVFRHLPIPVEQLTEAPIAAAREVGNVLRAFNASRQGEKEIASLTVTGIKPGPMWRADFEGDLPVPVAYENLLTGIKGISSDEPDAGPNSWTALVGVAMAAAGGPFTYEFRRDDLADTKTMRTIVMHAAFSGGLALLLVAGYIGYCYVDYKGAVAETKQIGDQIWQTYSETFPDSRRVLDGRHPQDRNMGGAMSFAAMQEDFGKIGPAQEGFTADFYNKPSLLDVLLELSEKLPNDKATITDVQVREGRGLDDASRVTIKGEVSDVSTFNEVYAGLEDSKVLSVEDKLLRVEGTKTTFTITARL
jgi:hypothetical protein